MTEEQKKWDAHLKCATDIVSTWPEWKQTLLGGEPVRKGSKVDAKTKGISKRAKKDRA